MVNDVKFVEAKKDVEEAYKQLISATIRLDKVVTEETVRNKHLLVGSRARRKVLLFDNGFTQAAVDAEDSFYDRVYKMRKCGL